MPALSDQLRRKTQASCLTEGTRFVLWRIVTCKAEWPGSLGRYVVLLLLLNILQWYQLSQLNLSDSFVVFYFLHLKFLLISSLHAV